MASSGARPLYTAISRATNGKKGPETEALVAGAVVFVAEVAASRSGW